MDEGIRIELLQVITDKYVRSDLPMNRNPMACIAMRIVGAYSEGAREIAIS